MARRRKKGDFSATLLIACILIILGALFGDSSHEDKTTATTKALTYTSSPTVTATLSTVPAVIATPKPTKEAPIHDYILNKNTHRFHYPYCNSVNDMKEKNKRYYTGTSEEVIDMGYVPCKNCDP